MTSEYPYEVFRKDGENLYSNGRFSTREEADICAANVKKFHGEVKVVIEGPNEEEVPKKRGPKPKEELVNG